MVFEHKYLNDSTLKLSDICSYAERSAEPAQCFEPVKEMRRQECMHRAIILETLVLKNVTDPENTRISQLRGYEFGHILELDSFCARRNDLAEISVQAPYHEPQTVF
jgi:hypothetical protein